MSVPSGTAPEPEAPTTSVAETPIAQENPIGSPADGDSGADKALSSAWDEVMQIIPQQLHSQVTPHFKNWDSNFSRKIQEVQTQWEPFKPFKDAGLQPEQIQQAITLQQALEQDPVKVFQSLQQYVTDNGLLPPVAEEPSGQEPGDGSAEIPSDFLNHPKFKEIETIVNTMAQALLSEQQQKAQQAEDQKVVDEITSLKEEFKAQGQFDEGWVITKALQDVNAGKNVTSLKPYVEQYFNFVNEVKTQQQRVAAPQVLGGGGIAPSSQFDPKTATPAERRAAIAAQLQATAQQS